MLSLIITERLKTYLITIYNLVTKMNMQLRIVTSFLFGISFCNAQKYTHELLFLLMCTAHLITPQSLVSLLEPGWSLTEITCCLMCLRGGTLWSAAKQGQEATRTTMKVLKSQVHSS